MTVDLNRYKLFTPPCKHDYVKHAEEERTCTCTRCGDTKMTRRDEESR